MSRDGIIILGLFLGALLLRVPVFWYPPAVAFDEGIFASHVSYIENHKTFFDIHPPLSKFLFWSATWGSKYGTIEPKHPTESFDDFPYTRARAVSVLAGSLLVVVVFLLGKEVFNSTRIALLPALLVLIDNALISYSRFILLDILLVLFGFAGVYCFLKFQKKESFSWLLSSAIFFGCAVSIKWTGLAFPLYALWMLVRTKKMRESVVIVVLMACMYLGLYGALFMKFPDKNYSLKMLPEYTAYIFKANLSNKEHVAESRPWGWPIGKNAIGFWKNEDGSKKIVLSGNYVSWIVGFLAVVFGGVRWLAGERPREMHFLAGFIIAYVPFFFIPRALFIYHYFPALIWSYFLVPSLFEKLGIQKRGYIIFAGGVLLCFLIFLPTTYGL